MKFQKEIFEQVDVLQHIRHDIHAHPELCYEEIRTSDVIAHTLESWGIPVLRGIGVTGVVGIVRQGGGPRSIGLRADMDALPMQELNQFPHASRHPGKMHGCGHDGHVAMLLGAAHYLKHHGRFDGTVYLIFQPAEEGGAGAKRMIEEGLFKRCSMDAVYGMHNWPGLPVGTLATRVGVMMASSNTFRVTVRGKGGHAAMPHLTTDPVMVAVQIAQAWQTIASRNVDPAEPAVLSVTQILAGSATNVIPDDAVLAGTVRTFSIETLDLIERRMREIAEHTARAFGAEVAFDFQRIYPPTINHDKETAFALQVIGDLQGESQGREVKEPSMGAEDFAFMLQERPGCYVWIGNGDGDHRSAGHGLGPCTLHNGSYDFNDALLPIGASFWAKLAEAALPAG